VTIVLTKKTKLMLTNSKLSNRNNYCNGQYGFTLVELIIYLSLLTLVLAGIYNYFFFSNQSSLRAQAESEVLQDARIVLMQMEKEIRQANRPRKLSDLNLPEGVGINDLPSGKAVVDGSSGTELTIYSYIGSSPKKISYRIINTGSFSVMDRSVDDPHIVTPVNWERVLEHIVTGTGSNYFVIQDKKVTIQMKLMDSNDNILNPVSVSSTFTVRGKEAMQ
jgi:type II secretory pathway pseudopilin PulG